MMRLLPTSWGAELVHCYGGLSCTDTYVKPAWAQGPTGLLLLSIMTTYYTSWHAAPASLTISGNQLVGLVDHAACMVQFTWAPAGVRGAHMHQLLYAAPA